MAKEQVAIEKAAMTVMPLPTFTRQSNNRDGKRRASGTRASSAKKRTRPASPSRSRIEERTASIDTPALAISVTATARQASGRKGKGDGEAPGRRSALAAVPMSTIRLATAIAKPAIENKPNAQRHDRYSAARAPSSGPVNAATPQIADIMAKSCGQMLRSNSRSTETKASETSAPPPS